MNLLKNYKYATKLNLCINTDGYRCKAAISTGNAGVIF